MEENYKSTLSENLKLAREVGQIQYDKREMNTFIQHLQAIMKTQSGDLTSAKN